MSFSSVLVALQPASMMLAALCLMISFVFSGVEAGLLAVNPARLRTRARAGERAARRLERLLQRPERLLATSLLVTNFMDLAALALVTDTLVESLGLWGYAVAFPILLPIFLLGVRLLPKALFRRFPYRTLALLAGPLEFMTRLLAPLLGLATWISRRLGLGRAFDPLRLSIAREQFGSLVAADVALKPAQREMIAQTLAFRRIAAREVARPLTPTMADRPDLRIEDAIAFAREHETDFIIALDAAGAPVIVERTFDLLMAPDRSALLRSISSTPLVATGDEPAHRVLRRLREGRREVAPLMKDGRASAMIRIEDLLQTMLAAKPAEPRAGVTA
jgi:CBS domain containing-hemolysin-like protein